MELNLRQPATMAEQVRRTERRGGGAAGARSAAMLKLLLLPTTIACADGEGVPEAGLGASRVSVRAAVACVCVLAVQRASAQAADGCPPSLHFPCSLSRSFKKSAKKIPGKGGLRWHKNVGLGFKTPKEAIEGERRRIARGGCAERSFSRPRENPAHSLALLSRTHTQPQAPTSTRSARSRATCRSVAAS